MAKSTDASDVPEDDDAQGAETGDETADDQSATRSETTDELWDEVGVQPVRIALPRDVVGYTLRAYRPAKELALVTAAAPEQPEEEDLFAARERARAAEDAEDSVQVLEESEEYAEEREPRRAGTGEATGDEPAPEDFEDEDEEQADAAAEEEVPVFLSHRGKLLLFATPEALVSFITADTSHDLAQLDSWPTLVKRVRAEDIVPTEEDSYELDLVVENLRGGHDAWNLPLLIGAGELARDLGYALRLEPVVTALASGSPLDDLDEACRSAAGGGIGGIFARRRLRKIGAQQASLGWRTIIGKISDAVDWRD